MYFIAVVAPADINDTVLKWKLLMKERFSCVVALRSPAHITLVPPFWMEDVKEDKLKNALDVFSRSQTPFAIAVKDFDVFKPRVIYVNVQPNNSLQSLRVRLEQFLLKQEYFPVKKEERPFHPHISIATRDLHKKAFREAWEIFKQKKYETTWIATGVSLLKHNQKNWDVIYTSQLENKFDAN
jgi:2'-5' RNA ligase